MTSVLHCLKHFFIVCLVLALAGIVLVVSQKGTIGFSASELAFQVGDEGPHIFHHGEKIEVLYIRGSRDQGFETESILYESDQSILGEVYFPLDDILFTVPVSTEYSIPPAIYEDEYPIIALSDLEGNFSAFKHFLIANKVIDQSLNWRFGKGHLVLLGDMVDRGYSTTQLLWLIYKLEQDAKAQGGRVHYVIGNHEIKNMQGNFRSAAHKYLAIAGILGKQQYELFGENSVIGRWLESKNTIEKINGFLFMHGGLHPDIGKLDLSLAQINADIRSQYRHFYVPRKGVNETQDLLVSTQTGPAWYRGYFKDDLNAMEIEESLQAFNADGIVVGHTIQFKVNSLYNGRVFAIDVKHPDDYNSSFPIKRSEGLLIENGKKFRLLDDGERVAL